MHKEAAPDELVGAIRKVCSGKKYVSESLAERMANMLDLNLEKPPHERLSDREFQVLCFIASGKSMTEIAKKLSLSVKTVSTFRTRILQKMGMENNAELIRYALTHGLIQ